MSREQNERNLICKLVLELFELESSKLRQLLGGLGDCKFIHATAPSELYSFKRSTIIYLFIHPRFFFRGSGGANGTQKGAGSEGESEGIGWEAEKRDERKTFVSKTHVLA